MTTVRPDVLRKRYHTIRRVLGSIFLISIGFWIIYSWGVFLEPQYRTYFFGIRDFWEGILLSLEWLFCVSILPFCAPGATKNYWLYIALLSGLSLWVYLRHLASIDCPYCGKMIDLNTDWECPRCHTVHNKPIWFTIFDRCKNLKCLRKPKIWECTNCRNEVSLLSPATQTPGQPPGSQSSQLTNIARFPPRTP